MSFIEFHDGYYWHRVCSDCGVEFNTWYESNRICAGCFFLRLYPGWKPCKGEEVNENRIKVPLS